jgi:hypothetical protein
VTRQIVEKYCSFFEFFYINVYIYVYNYICFSS